MEETNNIKSSGTGDKIEEVIKLFNTSLFMIRQKIAELEKEVKAEEDKEKIAKIKSRIEKIQE